MILPNVRASFGRAEAGWLLRLLADGDLAERRRLEELLSDRGLDALLDDSRALEAILTAPGISPVPASLALYVLLRRTLLDIGIESRVLADYLAALVLEFGSGRRALRIARYDDAEYGYLVDLMADLDDATGRRAFLLRAHLGNFALWLSGLFPDHIVWRVHRRGGPGIDYYERVGQTGFRMAAEDPFARANSLDGLYRKVASQFEPIRIALNRFSDGHLAPRASSPADRLLRQTQGAFTLNGGAGGATAGDAAAD